MQVISPEVLVDLVAGLLTNCPEAVICPTPPADHFMCAYYNKKIISTSTRTAYTSAKVSVLYCCYNSAAI